MNFKVTQIAAFSDNYALGKDNKLLWHFSEDLKRFKLLTIGKVMVMGRKTFESFPKPLPGRHHVIISRSSENLNKHNQNPMLHYFSDLRSAVEHAKVLSEKYSLAPEIMICGGAEIYKQTLDICDELLLTRVKGNFEADTFYPKDFSRNYTLLKSESSQAHPADLVYETWVFRR